MRDSVREQWFIKNGWRDDFSYVESVPLDAIIVDDAARDNIRVGVQLDADAVEKYKAALDDGAEFPAIIIVPAQPFGGKAGMYLIGDGIHRLASFKAAGRTATDAYVLNIETERELLLLRVTTNVPGGQGFATEQSVEQAVRLVNHGWTASDAARLFHISKGRVEGRLRAVATVQRIADLMPNLTVGKLLQHLPQSTLSALGRFKRDEALVTATEIAMGGGLTLQQVADLATTAAEAVTDAQSEAMITGWRKDFRPALMRYRGIASGAKKGNGAARSARQRERHNPTTKLGRAVVRIQQAITLYDRAVNPKKLTRTEQRDTGRSLRKFSDQLSERANVLSAVPTPAGLPSAPTRGAAAPRSRRPSA